MSAADDKYNNSAKGRARHYRYDRTAAGLRRKIAYDQRDGHDTYIQSDRLQEREEYEASGSTLSFLDWLNETHPLPPLVNLGLQRSESARIDHADKADAAKMSLLLAENPWLEQHFPKAAS